MDTGFGDATDLYEQIDNVDVMVSGLLAYLVSFTIREANRVVRNAGSDGIEAWRRLMNKFDAICYEESGDLGHGKILQNAREWRTLARALRIGCRRSGSMRSSLMGKDNHVEFQMTR